MTEHSGNHKSNHGSGSVFCVIHCHRPGFLHWSYNNSRVMVSPTNVSPSNNWQLLSIKQRSTMMLQLLAYLWFILNTNKVILPSPETINKCICMLFAFGNDDNKPCDNKYLLSIIQLDKCRWFCIYVLFLDLKFYVIFRL